MTVRLSIPVLRSAAVAAAVVLVVSACAGGTPSTGSAATSGATAAVVDGAGATPGGAATTAQRAVSVHGAVQVHRDPSASSPVTVRLAGSTPLGSPRVLLVQEVVPGWVQVALPTRPNGSTGWVAADQVRVETVNDLITVDLAARRLTLVVAGRTLTTTTVAIGSTANPTPTGRFFVTDLVRPPDPKGTYGAFALGLSGHSATLSEFGSGDGQIGIHGTNEPGSIGQPVSHGCIRVPDDVAPMLERVALGTPVVIT
jgi:lipoprotein-anchoring transpeptidase ErfK/SrfK